ncbi:hypothetical protein CHY_2524 [Carboxydothermus hydrogenoformans Z-2901]|uniref:Uncharacterized protein n=1 Tax=Carboxydothermus hydrogenoformans (strain ATCC BAA-161 / DSM 6008 / Z-2901) TaxID=246194 RepID=Q3A967_CARHZ|nr:hypothetical protein CHY_2524 [Carboxydothermus hydrogenoformans Z-2901]
MPKINFLRRENLEDGKIKTQKAYRNPDHRSISSQHVAGCCVWSGHVGYFKSN